MKVTPVGEALEYTPVALRLEARLYNAATGMGVGNPFASGPPYVGDWRYAVVELALDTFIESPDNPTKMAAGNITAATLAAVRLPALLRKGLAHVVLFVKDGGFSIDPQDFDERAVAAYVRAQLVADNPTTAVAEELGVTPNAAAQRVYRLRRAGRLPAVPKKGSK
jgi:hypothetical protein